jgi:hypothetical protein
MAISGNPQKKGGNWSKIFIIGGIGCVAVIGLGIFAIYRLVTGVMGEVMTEGTFEVTNPESFDPFSDLDEVVSGMALPSARLVSIEATGVRPDGTMDLSAEYTTGPRAKYQFIEPTDEGKEKMPPVGAGRKPDDVWARLVNAEAYRPGQTSHIRKMGGSINAEYWHTNEGVTVDPDSPRPQALPDALPPPRVSTQEMWEKALSLGAPKDAVAQVSYDAKGYGFWITGTKISLRWNVDGTFDELRSTPRE